MKILFVLHYPPPVHGSAIVGLQIKDSKIVNEAFDCKYVNLGTSISVDEIGKGKIIKLFRYFTIFWRIFRSVISNRPDLCYFSITAKGIPFYKDALLVLLVKLLGIKVVYHFHNKGVRDMQNKLFDNVLYRLVFKYSNVILLSKHLYHDIQKYAIKEQVYYCQNGIPAIEIMQNKKEAESAVEVLFLSNLIESKGIFVLLEVCKLLQHRKIIFHCTIVGGIGDVDEHQLRSKLQEMDLINQVNYEGKKLGTEKEEVFANTDIFIHPTLNDCFPLVILEAMQYSLPVVSSIEGGIPDIVEDGVTGYLVPKKDVETLAEKLEVLINNPELRHRMGKAGRQKYEREFTLKIFEQRLKSTLQQIIEKR
jgi:Glycosyltransferase